MCLPFGFSGLFHWHVATRKFLFIFFGGELNLLGPKALLRPVGWLGCRRYLAFVEPPP